MIRKLKIGLTFFLLIFNLPGFAQPDYSRIYKNAVEFRPFLTGSAQEPFNKRISLLGTLNPFLIPEYIKFLNSSGFSEANRYSAFNYLFSVEILQFNEEIDWEIKLLKADTLHSGNYKRRIEWLLQDLKMEPELRKSEPKNYPEPSQDDYFLVYLFLKGETGILKSTSVDYQILVDSLSGKLIKQADSLYSEVKAGKIVQESEIVTTWKKTRYWMKKSASPDSGNSNSLYQLISISRPEKVTYFTPTISDFVPPKIQFSHSLSLGIGSFRDFNSNKVSGLNQGLFPYPGFHSDVTLPKWSVYGEYSLRWTDSEFPFAELSFGYWYTYIKNELPGSKTRIVFIQYPQTQNYRDDYTFTYTVKSSSYRYKNQGYYLFTPVLKKWSFSLEVGLLFGTTESAFSAEIPYNLIIDRYNDLTGALAFRRLNKDYDNKIAGKSKKDFKEYSVRLKYIIPWFSEIGMTLSKEQVIFSGGLRLSF